MDHKALELQKTVREELIKRLYFLTVQSWPDELILPEQAAKELLSAHIRSFEVICVLADNDQEARAFKDQVYGGAVRGCDGYDVNELITNARKLAGPLLKRLQTEKASEEAERQHDLVLHTQRKYLREHSSTNPWLEDANVAIGGLPHIPKPRYKMHPLGGIVDAD